MQDNKVIKFEQVIRCVMELSEEEYALLEEGENSNWYHESEMFDDDGTILFGADSMILAEGEELEFICETQEWAEEVLERVQQFLAQGMKDND